MKNRCLRIELVQMNRVDRFRSIHHSGHGTLPQAKDETNCVTFDLSAGFPRLLESPGFFS